MVLYSIYQDIRKKRDKRIRAEGIDKGRAEGVAEGIALLEGYYRRKSEAEARGEVFDEPYPGSASKNGTGSS